MHFPSFLSIISLFPSEATIKQFISQETNLFITKLNPSISHICKELKVATIKFLSEQYKPTIFESNFIV